MKNSISRRSFIKRSIVGAVLVLLAAASFWMPRQQPLPIGPPSRGISSEPAPSRPTTGIIVSEIAPANLPTEPDARRAALAAVADPGQAEAVGCALGDEPPEVGSELLRAIPPQFRIAAERGFLLALSRHDPKAAAKMALYYSADGVESESNATIIVDAVLATGDEEFFSTWKAHMSKNGCALVEMMERGYRAAHAQPVASARFEAGNSP